MSTTFEIGRIPAAFRRALSQSGEGPTRDVLEDARGEARAEILVLDRDRASSRASGGRRAPAARCSSSGAQLDAEDRVHVARDAAHREQVGAVRGDLELEHVVRQRHARRRAARRARQPSPSTMIPSSSCEMSSSRSDRIMPSEVSPRSFGAPSGGRRAAQCRAARRRRCRRRRSSRRRTRSGAARPPPRRPGRAAGGRRSGACRPRARGRRRSAPRRRPRRAGRGARRPRPCRRRARAARVSSSSGGSSARWSASQCSGTFIARPPGTARGSARRCRRSS